MDITIYVLSFCYSALLLFVFFRWAMKASHHVRVHTGQLFVLWLFLGFVIAGGISKVFGVPLS
jgi:hypothetical protein